MKQIIIILLSILFLSKSIYANIDKSFEEELNRDFTEEDSGKKSFKIDDLHKAFGYTTLAVSITSIILGGINGYYYGKGKTPGLHLTVLHKSFSHAAIGLTATSLITGFIGFWRHFTFKKGLNVRNSHILLSLIYTATIVTSTVLAYTSDNNKDLNIKREFSPHCGLAVGSGAVIIASIVVLQF